MSTKTILKGTNMFHTPEDWDELFAYIEQFSESGEKIAAIVCAHMAWNLAAKLTQPEEESLTHDHCRLSLGH